MQFRKLQSRRRNTDKHTGSRKGKVNTRMNKHNNNKTNSKQSKEKDKIKKKSKETSTLMKLPTHNSNQSSEDQIMAFKYKDKICLTSIWKSSPQSKSLQEDQWFLPLINFRKINRREKEKNRWINIKKRETLS